MAWVTDIEIPPEMELKAACLPCSQPSKAAHAIERGRVILPFFNVDVNDYCMTICSLVGRNCTDQGIIYYHQ